jgi:INO80 complex subunit C
LKTVLGQEREREKNEREKRRQERIEAAVKMEVDGEPTPPRMPEQDEEIPTCEYP